MYVYRLGYVVAMQLRYCLNFVELLICMFVAQMVSNASICFKNKCYQRIFIMNTKLILLFFQASQGLNL